MSYDWLEHREKEAAVAVKSTLNKLNEIPLMFYRVAGFDSTRLLFNGRITALNAHVVKGYLLYFVQ